MKTGKLIGDEFAQYIVDAVETDGDIYRQTLHSVITNFAIKKVKGIYDRQKALKQMMYIAEDGIKKYKRRAEEYYEKPCGVISGSVKQKIAVELLAGIESEVHDLVREMTKLKNKGKPWQRPTTKKTIGKFGITSPVALQTLPKPFGNPTGNIQNTSRNNPLKEPSKSNAPEQFSNLFKGFKDPVKQETFLNRWNAKRPEQPDTKTWGFNKERPDTKTWGFNKERPDTKTWGFNKERPETQGYATGDNPGRTLPGWGIKKELSSQEYTKNPNINHQNYKPIGIRMPPLAITAGDTSSEWGLKTGSLPTTIGNYRKKHVKKPTKKTGCKR